MASTTNELTIGPLTSTLEVVVFVAFTGIAWFNGTELLIATSIFSKRRDGAYFYCMIAAALGVLVHQSSVFMIAFANHTNMYGVIAGLGIGWSAMILGQSLVLWSKLNVVSSSTWKLRLGLYLIIINSLCMHTLQIAISLLAVNKNSINTHRRSFEMVERISLALFSVQETALSAVFIVCGSRILHTSQSAGRETCDRTRVKRLILANISIIAITIVSITLESLVSWGIWASFKGLGYSLKLKIEFAVFKNMKVAIMNEDIAEMERVGTTNSATVQPVSPLYSSFSWPQRSSHARSRFGEINKGKRSDHMAIDQRGVRNGHSASVQEGPLGDKLETRCFSEVMLTPPQEA